MSVSYEEARQWIGKQVALVYDEDDFKSHAIKGVVKTVTETTVSLEPTVYEDEDDEMLNWELSELLRIDSLQDYELEAFTLNIVT